MLRHLILTLLCPCLVLSTARASDEATKLKTVKARSIELNVPATWKSSRPASQMRAAQFTIPGKTPSNQVAELVVYYFGGPTGGTKANIDRWVGQFHAKDRKVEMSQGKCTAGSYIWVDIAGTWKKPDGPPVARKTIDTPDSRVVNVILIEEAAGKRDYYFLKISGPKALVKSQSSALRVAIGADPDSEKPFRLEDAVD